jgi:multidrug efflux pump
MASRLPGAVEESSKGQGSIAAGVPMMLFIIFTLLMLQLQSFSRAMLVFLTGPLGIAGVAAPCCCSTGLSASWRCWA